MIKKQLIVILTIVIGSLYSLFAINVLTNSTKYSNFLNEKVLKHTYASTISPNGPLAKNSKNPSVSNNNNNKDFGDWRFAKDSSKNITINNRSSNKNFSCYQMAMSNRDWIPGGWTLNCVDSLKAKDMVSTETAGLTYPDSKTINILNKYSDYSIFSVMIHELAHAYDVTYFNDGDRDGIARIIGMKSQDFYSSNYQNAPDEEWARAYSYCYTGIEVDPIKYPKIDCNSVEKYVSDVKNRLGIDLHYMRGFNPITPLNNRKGNPIELKRK